MILLGVPWLLTSCGNGNAVTPSDPTTKLLIINTSPDAGPAACFINNLWLGGESLSPSQRLYFRFSATPSYRSINTGQLTIALRTEHSVALGLPVVDSIVTNRSYSMFLMGLRSKDSLITKILIDTAANPAQGRGKIRFVNASPRTPALDLTANGTTAFSKITYTNSTKYTELPAGVYSFKLMPTGASATILTSLSSVTILDGKLYTIYCKGLAGVTDTSAISLNIITNK